MKGDCRQSGNEDRVRHAKKPATAQRVDAFTIRHFHWQSSGYYRGEAVHEQEHSQRHQKRRKLQVGDQQAINRSDNND